MQGQYEDSETGLYYNRYRYFDANISAYISQDPIRLNAGTNLYFYGLNSVMWVDPLGLACKNTTSIQENEVTSYDEFRKRSVKGDNLEGHEVLQHSYLKEKGLATNRLGTEASKNNPVIALDKKVHKMVNSDQSKLINIKSQTGRQNIEANLSILRKNGVPEAQVKKIAKKAVKHAMKLNIF